MANKHSSAKTHKLVAAIIAIGMVIIAIAVLWQHLPYQNILTAKIKKTLEARGIIVTSLKLDSAGAGESIISDIQLGNANPLKVTSLKLGHSPQGLLQGRFNEVTADGISANIYKENGTWKISGLEPLMQIESDDSSDISSFFDSKSIRKILPQTIIVNNGDISVSDTKWSLATSFNLLFAADNDAMLNFESKSLSFDIKPYKFSAGAINLREKLEKNKWHGDLVINDITASGLPFEIEPMKLNSYLSATSEKFLATFNLRDAAKKIHMDFSLTFPPNNPEQGLLNIRKIQFPWGGGIISIRKISIPLKMDKPLPIAIDLHEVELSSLLGAISEGKINGTGKISGTIPLMYYPDGHITLQKGAAEAIEAGTIIVPATLLPGNNQALDIARSALENFHYTSLKIGVYSEGDEKSAIQLTLQGKNPDALEGRPVNLNIKLGGDVLPLLQQSLIPFNDLKHLLNEK